MQVSEKHPTSAANWIGEKTPAELKSSTTNEFVRRRWLLIVAAGCLISVWAYVALVCLPYTSSVGIHYGGPVAHYSDLYPPYVASRELLLNGRNPYGDDVTREIQLGVYGEIVDPSTGINQQGFAYPIYLTLLFAPLVGLPFTAIQSWFGLLLVGASALAVVAWSRSMRLPFDRAQTIAIVALTLSTVGIFNGLIVLQLSLLIALVLAGAVLALSRGRLVLAGVLLALAAAKPQLVAPLLVGVTVWSLMSLRRRQGVLWGFGLTMGLLLIGAELVMPGWLGAFVTRTGEYVQYTGAVSLLSALFLEPVGTILSVIAMLAVPIFWYFAGREAQPGIKFMWAVASTMLLTLLVIPGVYPYNQVLMIPALLVLGAVGVRAWQRGNRPLRYSYLLAAATLAWTPIAAALLAISAVVTNLAGVDATPLLWKLWYLPLYATNVVPLGLTLALALTMWTLRTEQRNEPMLPDGQLA